jgi:CMP-N,N'-diacetyllegionaminic acid synthase
MLALIPARSGSVRVPNKNVKLLAGHPLIAYTIAAAKSSGLFDRIFVCTDSEEYASIATYYGAEVPALRPIDISGPFSPDREWIHWLFSLDIISPYTSDHACILRPTNPFRTADTIKRACSVFSLSTADTLRAVRPVSEHPGKMWVRQGDHIVPLLPLNLNSVPFHSNQTAALFDVYVQDASLEIFSISSFLRGGQITGSSIVPFYCIDNEGLDINQPADFTQAEKIALGNRLLLPSIDKPPYYPRSADS